MARNEQAQAVAREGRLGHAREKRAIGRVGSEGGPLLPFPAAGLDLEEVHEPAVEVIARLQPRVVDATCPPVNCPRATSYVLVTTRVLRTASDGTLPAPKLSPSSVMLF